MASMHIFYYILRINLSILYKIVRRAKAQKGAGRCCFHSFYQAAGPATRKSYSLFIYTS